MARIVNKSAIAHFKKSPDNGTHPWLIQAASKARDLGLNEDETEELLAEHCAKRVSHRQIPHREIASITRWIFKQDSDAYKALAPAWPPFNVEFSLAAAAKVVPLF